jgi:predicted porin
VPKTVNASEIFGRRIDNAVSYFTPDTLGGFFGQLQAAPSEGAVSGKTSGMRLGYASERLIVSAANTQIDVSGGHFKQRAVGASYDFGYVKLLAQQMRSQSVTTTTVDETVLELGAVIPVTTAGTLKLGYAKASGSFEAIKPTVGYVHDLYKDTSVYTTYTYIKNNNDAAIYAVESASAAVAKQRDKSTGFEVGMRYKF